MEILFSNFSRVFLATIPAILVFGRSLDGIHDNGQQDKHLGNLIDSSWIGKYIWFGDVAGHVIAFGNQGHHRRCHQKRCHGVRGATSATGISGATAQGLHWFAIVIKIIALVERAYRGAPVTPRSKTPFGKDVYKRQVLRGRLFTANCLKLFSSTSLTFRLSSLPRPPASRWQPNKSRSWNLA